MSDVELVREILRQILEAGKRIERRFSPVGILMIFWLPTMGLTAWMPFA